MGKHTYTLYVKWDFTLWLSGTFQDTWFIWGKEWMTVVGYYFTTHLEKPVWTHKTSLLGVTSSGLGKHADCCIGLYFTRKHKAHTLSGLESERGDVEINDLAELHFHFKEWILPVSSGSLDLVNYIYMHMFSRIYIYIFLLC